MPYSFAIHESGSQQESILLDSKSKYNAIASDIILNQTDRLRLRFAPMLVNNSGDARKSVEGSIVLERKLPSSGRFPLDESSNAEKVTRGSVKSGDWLELRLDSSETFELFQGLQRMYALHDSVGVPFGTTRFVEMDAATSHAIELLKRDPSAVRMLAQDENFELVQSLLRILTQADSKKVLRSTLHNLESDNLQTLDTTLTTEQLRRVVIEFQENIDNDAEEYWQSSVFGQYPWILSQVFAAPITLFSEKAYVGGKGIENAGGNVCDFIYRNHMTRNVCLIEIKTPKTSLVGSHYRNTYAMSADLSGAVSQVLNYKDSLTKEYNELARNSAESFEVLSPRCAIVIGHSQELSDARRVAAFENFRNNLNGITIITYDELLKRMQDLLVVMSS